MKVLCGLGNPGSKYQNTRHNVGFLFLDFLMNCYESKGRKEKWNLIYDELIINGEKVLFVRPQSFMNLSGQPLSKLMNFFKLDKEDLCVIYDDIDLKFGDLRFRDSGSAGTHNGMKSIIECLGTKEFSRLRIGIESRGVDAPEQMSLSDFVLQDFSSSEMTKLSAIFKEAKGYIDDFLLK